MPVGISLKCNKCNYSVEISGSWEYYRDEKGERKQYGHPVALSEEAAEAGIYGHSTNVYCSRCDRIFDVISYEYVRPYKKGHRRFFSFRLLPKLPKIKEKYIKNDAIKCPKCGNIDLVIPEADIIRIVKCPRCNNGKMIPKEEWMS